MNRRLLAAATAATLLATGVAGCGIPDESGVQVDGPGPAQKYGSVDGSSIKPPERLDSGDDAKQLVTNFLEAAAGETSGAYSRVTNFVEPSQRGKIREKPGSDVVINVVRLVGDTPQSSYDLKTDTTEVTIRVQQVGLLRADGTLTPPVATESSYRFTIGRAQRGAGEVPAARGLYLLNVPQVLLMSTKALKTYYQAQTIYFWNADRSALVPDMRYLPLVLPRQGRANKVLDWLTNGPSDWLTSAVLRLPEGTNSIGNVLQNGDRIEVNLSSLAGPNEETELDRLAVQLAWSLRDLNGELELKIRNQTRKTIDDTGAYLLQNPLYRLADRPTRYCISGGAVHPLVGADTATGSMPVVPEFNRNVVSAAFSRDDDGVLAALVTKVGDERRLLTGTGSDVVRTFAEGAQTYRSMSRPVWLKSGDAERPVGLVVADGKLYRFGDNADLTEVRVPNATGKVTAVAAALDGHRIAFIAGGALFVAALAVDNGVVTPGPARRLVTSLGELTSVDWSKENSITLAGVKDRSAIYEITVDGALELELAADTGAQVTNISTYPDNPQVPSPAVRFMYEANSAAWEARYSVIEQIGQDQVGSKASPSTSSGTTSCTAPFFSY
ncbi:hypothetical protein GCM10027290_08200 [Micromonospora sonneratiae]|uniref:LpqB family beta-propeller domain-containing protein n=1 Tax=Micromonospora sonneratiae TaxID=1184706 RepID=A0ABW3YB14_9ACTN